MAEGFGRCRRQRNRTQLVPVAIKLCASLALGHRLFQGCCSLHKVAELLVERFLANERRSLLDTITARALPRLMLVTRHEHRGVLDHLNQAHLCAARQAQHRQLRPQRDQLWCLNVRKALKRIVRVSTAIEPARGAADGTLRGRDASYLAPPAQIRTCGFPAYGSHLGFRRQTNCRMRPSACDTRAWY